MKNKIDIIRLLTWICMDGTIVDHSKYTPGSIKIRIQFKLSKQYKLDALSKLLDKLKFKYTYKKATMSGCNVLQPYYIRIYGNYARECFKLLDGKKEFPDWFSNLNYKETIALIDTIEITDGYKPHQTIYWVSKNNKNPDIINKLSKKHLFKFYKTKDVKSGFSNKYNKSYGIKVR